MKVLTILTVILCNTLVIHKLLFQNIVQWREADIKRLIWMENHTKPVDFFLTHMEIIYVG